MADFVGVRPARADDVAAIVTIQERAWKIGYAGVLPTGALSAMTGAESEPVWRDKWADAVNTPPSARHRVLVAVDADEVTGFTAHAPATEPDLPSAAELLTLLVDPEHGRAGHGSRLLAASVDLLRTDGVSTLVCWVFEGDRALRGFLEPAGWAPDGARREVRLDGTALSMIRLVTDLTRE